MARTKASVGAKVSSGKSSKVRAMSTAPPSYSSSGSSEKSSNKYSGGNSVCPRETPKWQKPITNFFIGQQKPNDTHQHIEEETAGPSKPTKKKPNVIESDDETEPIEELPKNSELDESFQLTPLDGETSHKINEYLIENKENISAEKEITNNKRKSSKAELDSSVEDISDNKRIKIN